MDTNKLLDELLQSGKALAEQARNKAESGLNIPAQGPERDVMLDGLKKGALAAGGLALLLGTRGGRAVTGTALKLGSLAALGGLAYKTYQTWEKDGAEKPAHELTGNDADKRSRLLLTAMIMAAKADGQIDPAEQARLEKEILSLKMKTDEADYLKQLIHGSLDMEAVTKGVDSPEVAAEVYLASRVVIDSENPMEQQYLADLAQALGLQPAQVADLETQIGA